MATLQRPKEEHELKGMLITALRKEYLRVADILNKILDRKYVYCHMCDDHLNSTTFYSDSRYSSGYFPICKKCILKMVEQRIKKNDPPNETKESVQKVLLMMDLPYLDAFYEECIKGAEDAMKEKNRSSPFATYITCVKSLPQYKGLHWKDSDFGESAEDILSSGNRKPRREIRKLFGEGFSNEDYLYLQDQYDDWRSRVQVDSKPQETYIVRICFKLLDIWKAQRKGIPTKDLDKSLNELMNAANLQPRQNVVSASSDTLTFGQLIDKWENEQPIPEPDPEFQDVDGIARYINVFFKGHLAKMMGLKNAFSHEYDDYIEQYTVKKPEYHEDEASSDIFSSLFGKEVE